MNTTRKARVIATGEEVEVEEGAKSQTHWIDKTNKWHLGCELDFLDSPAELGVIDKFLEEFPVGDFSVNYRYDIPIIVDASGNAVSNDRIAKLLTALARERKKL